MPQLPLLPTLPTHSHRQYSTSTHHYHCSSCTFTTTGPVRNRIGKQQHHGAPAAAGQGGRGAGADQPMPKEKNMTGTKKSLSVLVLCTFCTLLAALEYHRGGATTQSVLQWGSDRLLLLGGGGEDKDAEGATGRLLMIGGGGGEAAAQEASPGNDRALIPTPDPHKRRKRTFFLDAGKAAMQVIQLPLKTVMFGLRKLFSLGRGGGKKGGKKQQHPQQSSSATKRGVLDMASLTEEELLWVEEVYQPLLAMAGITERGLAVKMPIDRECVARYFIAAQWRPALRGQPMLEQVLRTLEWREEERVAVLGPEDVLAQAWEGYLYVNGTDLMGRSMIYYRPAFQANKHPEKVIQYLVYTLERALDLSREKGGVEAYSFVIDCSGFSLSNMPPVKIIKQAFTLLHHHYPTRVGFIVFLYTGSAFQLLWKVLAPLVSPMTRNKIFFLPSGEEKKELLMRVEGGELDGRYGGEKEFAFVPHDYFGVSEEEAQRLYVKGGGKKGKK